jgi:arylsulfatase A-like enzyme
MSYKAVRTERAKLIHWVHKEGVDELYDLAADPYELRNVMRRPAYGKVRTRLYQELRKLVAEAAGL